MTGIGEAALLRKGVVLEPGQQAAGGRADHVDLREVHVQVNETRSEDAARQVLHGEARILRRQGGVGAHGQHHLAASRVGPHYQQTIRLVNSLAVGIKSQDGSAVTVHGVRA